MALDRFSPVAIGGIGGSGTRLVAQILIEAGFHLGSDLNAANDNLWFTLLFKRPWTFARGIPRSASEIAAGLRIFEKAMVRNGRDHDAAELAYVDRVAGEMARTGHDHLGRGRDDWAFERASRMTAPGRTPQRSYLGWGWKEPNTHLFLEALAAHFRDLHYVHVVRHGLDMAFSTNQTQLYLWGPLFGVSSPACEEEIPRAALRFWIAANTSAIIRARSLFGHRFRVIDFERLCADPRGEIDGLLAFLGVDRPRAARGRLYDLPRPPQSAGRYRRHSLATFSRQDLDAVRELGFAVEA
jgi:Sulfotransferase family